MIDKKDAIKKILENIKKQEKINIVEWKEYSSDMDFINAFLELVDDNGGTKKTNYYKGLISFLPKNIIESEEVLRKLFLTKIYNNVNQISPDLLKKSLENNNLLIEFAQGISDFKTDLLSEDGLRIYQKNPEFYQMLMNLNYLSYPSLLGAKNWETDFLKKINKQVILDVSKKMDFFNFFQYNKHEIPLSVYKELINEKDVSISNNISIYIDDNDTKLEDFGEILLANKIKDSVSILNTFFPNWVSSRWNHNNEKVRKIIEDVPSSYYDLSRDEQKKKENILLMSKVDNLKNCKQEYLTRIDLSMAEDDDFMFKIVENLANVEERLLKNIEGHMKLNNKYMREPLSGNEGYYLTRNEVLKEMFKKCGYNVNSKDDWSNFLTNNTDIYINVASLIEERKMKAENKRNENKRSFKKF